MKELIVVIIWVFVRIVKTIDDDVNSIVDTYIHPVFFSWVICYIRNSFDNHWHSIYQDISWQSDVLASKVLCLGLKLNFASTGIRLYYQKNTVREKACLQKLFFFAFCPIFVRFYFDESIDINYDLFLNKCTNCVDFYRTVRHLSTILYKRFKTFEIYFNLILTLDIKTKTYGSAEPEISYFEYPSKSGYFGPKTRLQIKYLENRNFPGGAIFCKY